MSLQLLWPVLCDNACHVDTTDAIPNGPEIRPLNNLAGKARKWALIIIIIIIISKNVLRISFVNFLTFLNVSIPD